ncbi:unnamed protein product [Discosporangium mesarthrocarpum]
MDGSLWASHGSADGGGGRWRELGPEGRGGWGGGEGGQASLFGWSAEDSEEGGKVALVRREYELLVARQLGDQQRYFEELIAKTVAEEAEANAPPEETLSLEEREEVAEAHREIEELVHRYEDVLDQLREEEV